MITGLLLSLTMLAVAADTNATGTKGTIQYEMVSSLNLNLEDIPGDLAAILPKEHKSAMVLYFTETSSLYENLGKPEKESSAFSSSSENTTIRFELSTGGDEEKTYTDLATGRTVEQKDFMGKKFLVSSTGDKPKWKISGRQKMLLGYPLQEAIDISGKDTVIAWFTTQIPVSAGPMGINGLPGLVLEASVGKNLTITATALTFGEDAGHKIKEPTKGRKVSPEQFKQIIQEKEEEMKTQYGGEGVHINRVIVR
ncbi:MAG: GLPGLI family protein [Chitinophagaceae bacterium]|nr:GLPGLI family protein [Chitinophagaceae bacterium]